MNKLPVLVLALAALVAGCSNKSETAAPAEAPAADAASQPESPAAAPTAEQIKQAAAAAQESGGTEESPGDASLERMAAMPEGAQLPAGKRKVGGVALVRCFSLVSSSISSVAVASPRRFFFEPPWVFGPMLITG